MTPCYDDGQCQVWQGDARTLPLADESVDLIVTSPPYNCRVAYEGYEDWLPWAEYWDGLIVLSMRECFRVLRHGGRIAVNIANVVRQDAGAGRMIHDGSTTSGKTRPLRYRAQNGRKWDPPGAGGKAWALILAPRMWSLLEDVGFMPREQLTWVKALSPEDIATSTAWGTWRSASNPVLRAVAEPVFIASKGSHARPAGESDLTADEFKAWTRNAWNISTGHADQYLGHPAMFPVELPRRLIKLYSYVGDVVLDPFCGSGTTLRAAKDVGRRSIGVDISPKYVVLTANRCRQDLLFGPGEVVA